jgi:hypothetical protein
MLELLIHPTLEMLEFLVRSGFEVGELFIHATLKVRQPFVHPSVGLVEAGNHLGAQSVDVAPAGKVRPSIGWKHRHQ